MSSLSPDNINQAVGYLKSSKREFLSSSWAPNRFVRFRINKEDSSITEAILRTSQGKDFKTDNLEFDKFYNDLRKHLQKPSEKTEEEILKILLANDSLKEVLDLYNARLLNADKAKSIKDLNFYFTDNTERGFKFLGSLIENFKGNCILYEYLAQSKIGLNNINLQKYSYFNSRINDKNLYNKIDYDFHQLKNEIKEKDNKSNELCNIIKGNINERIKLDVSSFFYKSLFSTEIIRDYRIYLYDMYPYIFKTNFIIMIPWSNDVTVEDIIIKDSTYPYIILFKPFERTNFVYETGAYLITGRRVRYVIYPDKDKNLLASILINYNSNFSSMIKKNYKKYIDFKKENEETAADRYYEYISKESSKYRYTGQNKDINKFIRDLKYYQTDIDDIIKHMNL